MDEYAIKKIVNNIKTIFKIELSGFLLFLKIEYISTASMIISSNMRIIFI